MPRYNEELFEGLSPLANAGWGRINEIQALKNVNVDNMTNKDLEAVGNLILINHKAEHKLLGMV